MKNFFLSPVSVVICGHCTECFSFDSIISSSLLPLQKDLPTVAGSRYPKGQNLDGSLSAEQPPTQSVHTVHSAAPAHPRKNQLPMESWNARDSCSTNRKLSKPRSPSKFQAPSSQETSVLLAGVRLATNLPRSPLRIMDPVSNTRYRCYARSRASRSAGYTRPR